MTQMKYPNHFFRDYRGVTPVDSVILAYKAGQLPQTPPPPTKHYAQLSTGVHKPVTNYSHRRVIDGKHIPNYRRG